MQKYFAYGSNCSLSVLQRKQVSCSSRCRAVLTGHRLLFNKRSLREHLPDTIGYANVDVCEGSIVEGVLYEVGDDDLIRLDASERYPVHYDRVRTTVDSNGRPEVCWMYRAQPDVVSDGLVPSRDYLNQILSAGLLLSRDYYEALARTPTYRDQCVRCHRHGEVLFVQQGNQLHRMCVVCGSENGVPSTAGA